MKLIKAKELVDKYEYQEYEFYKKGEFYYINVSKNFILCTNLNDKSFCNIGNKNKRRFKIDLGKYLLEKVITNQHKIKAIDIDKRRGLIKEVVNFADSFNVEVNKDIYTEHNKKILEEYEVTKNKNPLS